MSTINKLRAVCQIRLSTGPQSTNVANGCVALNPQAIGARMLTESWSNEHDAPIWR